MNELQLIAIKERLPWNPHRVGPSDPNLSKIDNWIKDGKPYCWVEVEQREGYTAFKDVGYGYMALFKDNQFLSASKEAVIVSEGVVLLDKEYYCIDKYIWL